MIRNLLIKLELTLRRSVPFLGKKFVFVAIGDSSIEGVGATRHERSFAHLVYLSAKQELGNVRYVNLGKRGARVSDVLADQLDAAIAASPDIVLVSAGANDIRKMTKLSVFEADLGKILDQLRRKTNALIVVNSIPDMSIAPSIPRLVKPAVAVLVKRLNRKIKEQTEKVGGIFIDLFNQSKIYKDFSEFVSDDGFHPSDGGYALWANTIITTIKDAIFSLKKSDFDPGLAK